MFEDVSSELPSPAYLEAIGALTILWNQVEELRERLLWHTLKLDYVSGRSLSTHIGNVTKSEILRNLSEINHSYENYDAVCYFLKLMDANRGNRNQIIHSQIWEQAEGHSPHVIQYSAKKGLKEKILIADLDVLRRVLHDIKSNFSYGAAISLRINPDSYPFARNDGAPPPLLDKPSMPKSLPWHHLDR